jgi:hypothetical protein
MSSSHKRQHRNPSASDAKASKRPRAKKKYRSPLLVDYGSIAKLTRASTGSIGDSGGGGMMKVCL